MSIELSPGILRAMHRRPALLSPNENPTQATLPITEPIQQPPALALESGGEASGAGRPHCLIVQRRVRLLDVDAKWAAVKDLLDALVSCGALPGDREDQITLEVRQEKVAHFSEETTEVEITTP